MAATRPPLYVEPELEVRAEAALEAYAEPQLKAHRAHDLEVRTALGHTAPAETPAETSDEAAAAPVVLPHEVEIVESGSFARAVCQDCGWSGPARRARATAVADLQLHA